jgi:outer membrane protein OmpA-like peptidoglycan-associated protein
MLRSLLAILGIAFAVAACQQSPQLATPAPAPAPAPTKDWMVFFDTNSTTLSPDATTTVSDAANVAKSMPSSKVTVIGYTDTVGSVAYNKALSLKRANAVKDALVGSGVTAQSITVNGDGEQGLLVQTPDQMKQAKNRRVQIVVQ